MDLEARVAALENARAGIVHLEDSFAVPNPYKGRVKTGQILQILIDAAGVIWMPAHTRSGGLMVRACNDAGPGEMIRLSTRVQDGPIVRTMAD